MALRRGVAAVVAVVCVAGSVGAGGVTTAVGAPAAQVHTSVTWRDSARHGSVRLAGEVPLSVRHAGGRSTSVARLIGTHGATSSISLNFALPLRHRRALNTLINREAKTHRYLSRSTLYRRFAPPRAQVATLRHWLISHGFHVSHIGRDRTAVAASASTSTVAQALSTHVSDFTRSAYTYHGVKVPSYSFYANTTNPRVPARLGIQSISGLTDVDQFFTDAQLSAGASRVAAKHARPQSILTRAGSGYLPEDLRAMYDVTGHGVDATGQTLGFTLWGAGETQSAMTTFASDTGDQPITVDTACAATGNSVTIASQCTTDQPQPDHLESILENGNTNGSQGTFEYAGNDETALDVEQAHGMATGAAMKYYLSDCSNVVPSGSGLTNATCNGSDVGMEEAVEDAADDPTLHTVSNSWGYGGDVEFGSNDPFELTTESSFAMAAAAGTTFWFSTGDDGSYESGYPADSDYVVGVGGTSDYSTTTLAAMTPSTAATRSTQTTWVGGGSWCSNLEPRPSWQTGAAVTAKAPCPGRIVPDVSALADTNTGVFEAYTSADTNGVATVRSGTVGGTSVAAPELSGLEAVTEAYLAQQTYSSGTIPAVGFEGPMLYQLGNSADGASYFTDVDCGNTASPSGGPDGDAASAGWDPATGWGELDWFTYSTGYAIALGATGLSQPSPAPGGYAFGCAQTPTNASQRSISMPTSSMAYSVGSPSSTTPWPATYLTRNAWGASNNFLKTTDGGATWQTTNSDMMGVACVSRTVCVEVGDGGRIRRTTDSGITWTYVNSPFNKALTSIACPTASACYAAGDRGTVLKSTDGGATWAFLPSADGSPLYGLACPSASTCYAVDDYAHVDKTSNGGASWTLQSTPITTPGADVPGSGGPNPFAGLFAITCTSISNCVAVGGYPPAGTDPPIVITTDGGNTWHLETSNAGSTTSGNTTTGNYLNGVSCVGSTCYAVGRTGAIVTSADSGATWVAMTSNTTNELTGITCTSAASCVATGQAATVDVLNNGVWTPAAAPANSAFLAAVTCTSATSCLAVGKQGSTIGFDSTNFPGSAVLEAGGGTTQQMNSISCVDATDCVAVGAAGTILQTANGGQTWVLRASGVTVSLAGVSCISTSCEAVGAVTAGAAQILVSVDGGTTWSVRSSGSTSALTAVACTSTASCTAVGNAGVILETIDSGSDWFSAPSGTTAGLTGIACVTGTNDCFVSGAIASGGTQGTILATTDGGTTWTAQTSNSPQGLTSIACADDLACFSAGAIGTIVSTIDGGQTWAQQGNPISGPTSALNAGPTGITASFAAACTTTACDFGTASAGDIMTTQLLTVTVNAQGTFGDTPPLTGLSPGDSAITYSPASEASTVTGSLTCTTTATSTSDPTVYPVSGCSGFSDPGFSVVYDVDDSSYVVNDAAQTITFGSLDPKTFGDASFEINPTASSGLAVSLSTIGPCTVDSATSPANVSLTGAGTCQITASQSGDGDVSPASSVLQNFTIAKAAQTIAFATPPDVAFRSGNVTVSPTASSTLAVLIAVSGSCSATGDTIHPTGAGSCTVTATQSGDSDYDAAPTVARSFTITNGVQHITFKPLANRSFGSPPFTLHATASSGLFVSFASTTPSSCTISGRAITMDAAKSCTVVARQAGSTNWAAAMTVSRTFTITKATPTVKIVAAVRHPKAGKGAFDVTVFGKGTIAPSGKVTVKAGTHSCTISHLSKAGTGSCSVKVAAGRHKVTANYSGNANYHAAQGSTTVTIAKLTM